MPNDKILDFPQKIAYRETILVDSNGEVIKDVIQKPTSSNGGGFVLSYTEKMSDFIAKCKVGSVVRVFLYIAHHQSFGNDGIQFGYRCSHKFLSQVLSLDAKTVYSALAYLKDKYLVNESRIEGQLEFMVNPYYVTVGNDRKIRIREWERRWGRGV